METKLRQNKIQNLRIKLGMDGAFVVDCVGHSGGLALLWRAEVDITIQNYSRRHINVIVTNTGFYVQLDVAHREEGWNLLRHLRTFGPLPWFCVGDFN
ncbi:hypothetical protein SLA2020_440170 [Shorea laevis]